MSERHGWTHPICSKCYEALEPSRGPVRVLVEAAEGCCWCGKFFDGIYYRAKTPRMCPDAAEEHPTGEPVK